MAHPISGRLDWDTTHAATPCWLLFLDGHAGDAPMISPVYDTRTPHHASPSELARLIGEMLHGKPGTCPGRCSSHGSRKAICIILSH